MKIILIGYMGCGKSTLGKKLSSIKNIPFIDLDEYIIKHENKYIQDIFRDKGEIYFRKIETLYLQEILQNNDNFILSLGGGTPCYGNNISLIKNPHILSIYLKYLPKNLAQRLLNETNQRPLLQQINNTNLEDFIRKHLFDRAPYYSQASITIPMDNLSEDESLQLLLSHIPNN